MKNKEKYDLRCIDFQISSNHLIGSINFRITHNIFGILKTYEVDVSQSHRLIGVYNEWLEEEVQEDA